MLLGHYRRQLVLEGSNRQKALLVHWAAVAGEVGPREEDYPVEGAEVRQDASDLEVGQGRAANQAATSQA